MDWLPEGYYEQLELSGESLDGVVAPGARFLDCRFTTCSLTGGDLEATTWRGGSLSGTRVIGTALARSLWQGVSIEDCAFSGVELFHSQLRKVVFRGGLLQGVNLRQSRLEDVVFEDCTLRDVDLGAAVLERVSFPGSRIERIDLTAMKSRSMDLRGASVSIARGFDRLRGVVIDHGQLIDLAPALAQELGLQVRGRDESL